MPQRPDPRGRLMVEVDGPDRTRSATVRLRGEIDLATAPGLQRKLETVLGEGVQDLVLDLCAVRFCDVPTLNVLLRAQSRLSSRGGRLTVLGPCPPLQVMINVLGLADRLPVTGKGVTDPAERGGQDGAGTG
jgi:anti-sigma B factor antagonist